MMNKLATIAILAGVSMLVSGAQAFGDAPDNSNRTTPRDSSKSGHKASLIRAAQHGEVEAVRQLVRYGVDINQRVKDREDHGATALMMACRDNPDPEVVSTLIELGASVSARSGDGLTALMYAMLRDQDDGVIDLLLEHGAMVGARDARGRSVLMYACTSDTKVSMIERLIEQGASVKARDANGVSAMMHATKREHISGVFELLTDHGASVDEHDALGRSVIMHAAMNAQSGEVIDRLVELGADVKEKLSVEQVKQAASFGEWKPAVGNTVLSFACIENPHPEVFQALFRHRADVHAEVMVAVRTRNGISDHIMRKSHLYLVAEYTESPEVLDAILDAGASPKTFKLVHSGLSPLQAARSNKSLKDTAAFWRLNDLSYD